jgi:molybdate transport system permease protein
MPRVLLAVAVLGLAIFFVLPLAGLLGRAPWPTIAHDLGSHSVRSALVLSLVCSVSATALAVAFGVPIAWVLARTSFAGRRIVRGLAMLPLVLPPVVGGVALLFAFGRRGLVGRLIGVQLPFTTAGAVLAEAFVALPFLIVTVEAALRSLDPGFEETASALGAGPWDVFRRVTVRMVGPSLAGGVALAWARAIGEFGATITFAGNVPGRTQTLPLAVYNALETDPHAAIALSVVLLALSVGVLVIVGGRTIAIGRATR